MKKLFRILLTSIFLFSYLNVCHAENIIPNLYNSSSTENKIQASSLKKIKPLLKCAMENRESSMVINYKGMDCYKSGNIDMQKIEDILKEILNENHYLKYSLREYHIKVSGYYGDATIEFNFKYLTTKAQEEYVESRVKSILSHIITEDMNDYAKEKAIHDYIVSNVIYDTDLKEYSAYSALAKGKAVCQGYSLLMFKMLEQVGIKSIIVESIPMNHVWNMVYIDNKWYHVDVTWNDAIPHLDNRILYDYYNLTDDEISQSIKNNRHTWEKEEYPRAINKYDPSIVTMQTYKAESDNIKVITSNNIMFNIKSDKNVDVQKVQLFDEDKLLQSKSNVNSNIVFMNYDEKLEEKPYKLKTTLSDETTYCNYVEIKPTSKVIEIDNENKLVRVKALIDGQLVVNGKVSKNVKKDDIVTIYKDEILIIVPFMNERHNNFILE